MKAETILKLIERALNPDLKIAHIKAYAEAMILKDRDDASNKIIGYATKETVNGIIKNRPIILD